MACLIVIQMSNGYTIEVTDKFKDAIKRIEKKDKELCEMIKRKVREIVSQRNPARRGSMKYEKSGLNHAHVGHFVLYFVVDREAKTVLLVDFKHHD